MLEIIDVLLMVFFLFLNFAIYYIKFNYAGFMPNLYVVATPIGNLGDITLRALDVLKSVDWIVAEDTRVISKLLAHFSISKSLLSLHQYSKDKSYDKVLDLLKEGKNVALVSDAGTPCISDPGSYLVELVRKNISEAKIIAIPGPSAVISALSIAGVPADQFTFLGFPPHQKGRQKFFNILKDVAIKPIVLYESTHRLQKTFKNLKIVLGGEAKTMVGKELTKIYEELWQGTVDEAVKYFVGDKIKGEFVIIVP